MNVENVIKIIANLSEGLDDPTKEDKEIYLKYLNLAYEELFKLIIQVNPEVKILIEKLKVQNGIA